MKKEPFAFTLLVLSALGFWTFLPPLLVHGDSPACQNPSEIHISNPCDPKNGETNYLYYGNPLAVQAINSFPNLPVDLTTTPDTLTPTDTIAETSTETPVPGTNTPTPTETLISGTDTPTYTITLIPGTDTPTVTETFVSTGTETPIPTETSTLFVPPTITAVPTEVPTSTGTHTATPLPSDTATFTATATNTPIPTGTPTPTGTATQTVIPTGTVTISPSTQTPTITFTLTRTPTETLTPTGTATGTSTFVPSATPIPDTITPQANWSAPVVNGMSYTTLITSNILLAANASDNISVTKVRFFRWDFINNLFMDIGYDLTPPYQWNLDASTLYIGYNEIDVEAYDTTGNKSLRMHIFIRNIGFEYLPISRK